MPVGGDLVSSLSIALSFHPCGLSSLQQAKELVMEILRERDQPGFGERNDYGSRMGGGGIDVSPSEHYRINWW